MHLLSDSYRHREELVAVAGTWDRGFFRILSCAVMVIGMELPLCASLLCGLQVGRSSGLLGDWEAERNTGAVDLATTSQADL